MKVCIMPRVQVLQLRPAVLRYERGARAEAAAHLRKSLAIDPIDSDADRRLDIALIFSDVSEAIRAFQRSLDVNKDNPEARLLLSLALAATSEAILGLRQRDSDTIEKLLRISEANHKGDFPRMLDEASGKPRLTRPPRSKARASKMNL